MEAPVKSANNNERFKPSAPQYATKSGHQKDAHTKRHLDQRATRDKVNEIHQGTDHRTDRVEYTKPERLKLGPSEVTAGR